MTFQPILPVSGYGGWVFLSRTIEPQKEAFVRSPQIQRDMEYFRENIAEVKSADDLVNDRRLLGVALGAFGLDDDINAKAFIRKVLDEGTAQPGDFANRLADKRYATMSLEFGFGDLGGLTGTPGFAEDILARYEDRQFERAVGEQDGAMRQALNLSTALDDILDAADSEKARWFTLMGNPAVRDLMETALGLPSSLATLDLDLQLEAFRDRAKSVFGTSDLEEINTDDNREKAIRLFLIRTDAEQSAFSSGASVALSLLQAGSRY